MNNLFEQWNQGHKIFQLIPPLNSKILESSTFATNPRFLANLDELEQFFRIFTGLNIKDLEGFPYLKSDLANFENTEELLQRQMNIVFELSYNTLDYMQRSFQIMEKEIQLLVELTKDTCLGSTPIKRVL
ncbi:hypothetical protein [Legionella drancourtii]|uniref:Phasin domain-containing protein n=1 Tax=Legionella drancourtii LLAP12 TaxID=658187 RepID=G9EP77_9GAMM|nr:hypothetical protein [Legionella drancourtii]EHL30912.1 hypothetical protein LDG_7059 [Legionella drancourtii LLAP12]